ARGAAPGPVDWVVGPREGAGRDHVGRRRDARRGDGRARCLGAAAVADRGRRASAVVRLPRRHRTEPVLLDVADRPWRSRARVPRGPRVGGAPVRPARRAADASVRARAARVRPPASVMSTPGSIPFDRAADVYDETRRLTPEASAATTHLLAAELGERGAALEIGVGTGLIGLPLAAAGVRLVGLDLSR